MLGEAYHQSARRGGIHRSSRRPFEAREASKLHTRAGCFAKLRTTTTPRRIATRVGAFSRINSVQEAPRHDFRQGRQVGRRRLRGPRGDRVFEARVFEQRAMLKCDRETSICGRRRRVGVAGTGQGRRGQPAGDRRESLRWSVSTSCGAGGYRREGERRRRPSKPLWMLRTTGASRPVLSNCVRRRSGRACATLRRRC